MFIVLRCMFIVKLIFIRIFNHLQMMYVGELSQQFMPNKNYIKKNDVCTIICEHTYIKIQMLYFDLKNV